MSRVLPPWPESATGVKELRAYQHPGRLTVNEQSVVGMGVLDEPSHSIQNILSRGLGARV